MTDQPNATTVDKSRTVPCPEYRCGAPAGEACLRLDGTRSTVSHARRWRAYDRAQQAHAKSAPAPMTPVPDFVAGARALLAATRSADLLAEVERHILLLADQPDSALGDVPPSRRRGYLDAAAVVGRYRALLADQTAARTTPDNPATSGDAADNPSCICGADDHRIVGCCPGALHRNGCAAPATADDGLRARVAAAIRALNEGGTMADLEDEADVYGLADAVLAVRDRRMEQLTVRAEGVERSVQLLTTDLLNVAQQRDQAEAAIARVRSLTGRWAKRTDQLKRAAELLDDALAGPETDHA